MTKFLLSAVFTVILTGHMASAATVTVEFENGVLSNNVYVEKNFTFTTTSGGGVGFSNDCGTPCLQLNNNEIVTVTYGGGVFDMLGFMFRAPGNPGDLGIPGGTVTESTTITGNNLSEANFTTEYLGISLFTFANVNNGSGRVDNIRFAVADIVPPPSPVSVPASGLLLLTAIGAVAARRRRKLI